MKLTDEQNAVVQHSDGHSRVIAVAGAGKTAALIHYLERQLNANADPRRILVVMYNRAAKNDFEARFYNRLPQSVSLRPTIRTFHALGLKLYQGLISQKLLPQVSLTPLPSSSVDLKIKQLLQASNQQTYSFFDSELLQEWVETTRSFIQIVKCNLHSAEDTLKTIEELKDNSFLSEIFEQFEQWRKNQKAITYDDMLYDPAKIFEKNPQSQSLFSNKLDQILVDEYQDINPIQHYLLTVISGNRAKVTVIGDPDQTIYEFRGSSPSFINSTFKKDFHNPRTYTLSRTFRFGHELSLAANHLISNNRERENILTLSDTNTPTTKIHLAETENHGAKIATTISTLHENGAAYSGMAILCRLWSYARPVELQLMARGIAYNIEGGQSILHCKEIRPLMHFLRIMAGPFFTGNLQEKTHTLFEILSIPSPKIPNQILKDIAKIWAGNIQEKNIHQSLKKAIPSNLADHQKKTLKKTIEALKHIDNTKNYATSLKKYTASLEYQKKLQDNAFSPTQGIEQAGTVNAFITFITSLDIKHPLDVYDYLVAMQEPKASEHIDAVTITTIHRSKGLEWPAVFIPDITEGHIPYIGNSNSIDMDTLESERRLMYVAITRAQKKLFLTTSNTKTKGHASQSRFIHEMELAACKVISDSIYEKKSDVITNNKKVKSITEQYISALQLPIQVLYTAPKKPPSSAQQRSGIKWEVGNRVEHAILGEGEITKFDNKRIEIRFNNGETRKFVAHIAEPHLSLIRHR